MSFRKRILKDYQQLQNYNIDDLFSANMDENNIRLWTIQIIGPENTPFEGGIFTFQLDLPPEYPFKAPTIRCRTNIYIYTTRTFK